MKIIDLHQDIAYANQTGKDVINEQEKQSSIKMLSKFEDAIIFASIFPHIETLNEKSHQLASLYNRPMRGTAFSFPLFLDQLKFYYYLERKGIAKIVKKETDLNVKGIKLLISLEGSDILRDFEDLYLIKEMHVLSLGLTWNYDNKFAASCMTKKDFGLTEEGEELVKLANSLGIIIDLAHASKNTLLEAASITKKPIIVSHANVRKLKEHRRNLDDEEIETVIKTQGIIGVTAIVETLSEAKIENIVENIRYIGENFGWQYVAIGTDFLGIESVPKGFENILKIKDVADLIEEHKDEVLWKNAMRVIQKNLLSNN